mmetsp:Transcript_10087/g.14240  ORF Transcript_10087/g.14240 Transcript_10087/m.14240 type:complete len:218 (+) Transcript_10087:247-900(+)
MSSVLLIWGLGGAGYAVVLGPFLTGFLGCERKDFLIVGGLALASMLVAYVLLLGPMVRAVGDIRVLQLSLLASVTFPLCLTAVVNLQQFLLLITFFAGPIALAYPIVSAIKSNLVHKEEQGLVQGTVASIGKAAAVLSFLTFSFLLKASSGNGGVDSERASVLPSFFLIALITVFALVLACTLPLEIPKPETKAAEDDEVELALRTSQAPNHDPNHE